MYRCAFSFLNSKKHRRKGRKCKHTILSISKHAFPGVGKMKDLLIVLTMFEINRPDLFLRYHEHRALLRNDIWIEEILDVLGQHTLLNRCLV